MTWTCQRRTGGQKCGYVNDARVKKCVACGKLRPRKRQPAHRVALDLSYAEYVVINGGSEACGICGRPRGRQRHHRDHDHRTSQPRGLLCFHCNHQLPPWVDAEWLEAAAAYLRRVAQTPALPPRGTFGKGSASTVPGQLGGTLDAADAIPGLANPGSHLGSGRGTA